MSAETDAVYILRPSDEGETDDDAAWMRPEPVDEVVFDAVAEAAETDPEEFDALSAYVDYDELVAVLDGAEDGGDASITFTVEGCEVTLDAAGTVTVDGEDGD